MKLSRSNDDKELLSCEKLINLYKYGEKVSPWEELSREKLEKVKERLEERVKGQSEAIAKIKDVLIRAFTGFSGLQHSSKQKKPKGTLFFVGPTGVGKTELAKALAEFVFGDESACIRFNISEEDMITIIERSLNANGIEGVSFIGGEPVLQAKGLAEIAGWCRGHGLSVLIFTGYNYDDLLEMNDPFVDELLGYTDLLIDGEFDEEQYDNERPWIGSKNQKVYHLSDRYPKGIELNGSERKMDIRISDKEILINGWPFGL